uniref:Multiple coagulation factor deficiency 2 [Rattus norvegicus] n=1 Tax=Lepeophtheirus salmonis TaxID=72036 RepID=D3PHX7_LEPSM|nr:Multiple coagulation factor deficiency protein 2 homolog [Lepeophtheirus salmonis]
MNLSVILFVICASISRILGHEGSIMHGIVPDKESLEHQMKHTHEPHVNMNKLSSDERVMEYFNMFDLDKNGFVDGLESTKKMLEMQLEHKEFSQEELMNHLNFDGNAFKGVLQIVDDQLQRTDKNEDGYISYSEFKTAMNF